MTDPAICICVLKGELRDCWKFLGSLQDGTSRATVDRVFNPSNVALAGEFVVTSLT